MKLAHVLAALFLLQTALLALALQTTYMATHDTVNDFSKLDGLIPLGLFVILALISAILMAKYLSHRPTVRSRSLAASLVIWFIAVVMYIPLSQLIG
jgi:hypothetical protein